VTRNKLKLSSDGGNSGKKECKQSYGGAFGGVWWRLRLSGVWNQAFSFVLGRLALILLEFFLSVVYFTTLFQ
jgi:hypothetical protein